MSIIDRTNFADLRLFLAIVRRQSFSAAAIELGVSPSAASHAMRRLEAKLGIKLLNRTSRAVRPTDLGMQLADRLAEGFEAIEDALQSVQAPGTTKFGELRINAFSDAAKLLLEPALPEFALRSPETRLMLSIDERPIDIVAEGYDAGIRYGHNVPEDMVAVPLSGPHKWIVVAAPVYLERCGAPEHPSELTDHTCIQLLLGDNSIYPWELRESPSGAEKSWRVPGNITIKDTETTIASAISGVGLAYVLQARVQRHLDAGRLQIVLENYAAAGEPFHFYYASRRHNHPGLRMLTNIIRKQNGLKPL